jgi:hypothetical protein
MTKLVALRSIEHGVRRAISILGDEGVTEAIKDLLGVRRSASLIRKCADPDNDRHHLQFRYGVALDIACHNVTQRPPLLEVYRHLVEHHTSSHQLAPVEGGARVTHAVLALQAALGDLAETVGEATHADSPGGVRLTNLEKHEIYESLVTIEQQTETIKRMIAA